MNKEEILVGKIYDGEYDFAKQKIVKKKIYNIYYDRMEKVVYVDAPFPVRYLTKLRRYLDFEMFNYKNIIIGKPYI